MKEPSEWVIKYAQNNYTSSAGKAVKELMECYNYAKQETHRLTTQVVEAERKYSELKEIVIQYGEALKCVMSQMVESGKADALSMTHLSEMTVKIDSIINS